MTWRVWSLYRSEFGKFYYVSKSNLGSEFDITVAFIVLIYQKRDWGQRCAGPWGADSARYLHCIWYGRQSFNASSSTSPLRPVCFAGRDQQLLSAWHSGPEAAGQINEDHITVTSLKNDRNTPISLD